MYNRQALASVFWGAHLAGLFELSRVADRLASPGLTPRARCGKR